MKASLARVALPLMLGAALAGPVVAQQGAAPAPAAAEAASGTEPSAAILELRRRFLDPGFMALAFHNMDGIFATQAVENGQRSHALPRAERPLDFTYDVDGRPIPAEDVLERTFTNALMIVRDGKVVYERYRNFTDERTRFTSMSMSKSITSILIGIAVDQGAIRSIDDQITTYVPELKGTPYDGVTIRDALEMKTGVDRSDGDQLKAGSEGAARREQILVRNALPAVDEAFMIRRKAEPGKTFDYSTLNVTILGWVLEKATGQPITAFTSRHLWQPMGAEAPAYWMADGPGAKGRPLTGMGYNATMRDYARIGMMMLDQGRANGRQVVSRKWVSETTGGPHPAIAPGASRGYQFLWWTVPGMPAYMADGLAGQYIYIDPPTRTVIVKLSYVPLTSRQTGEETSAFFRAACAWAARQGR
ncbi:MAG: hypothetical protein DI547_02085 [Sphingobium sp.]|nr:MAG: hypothetical protein DI547_02085 [Sphingobium sp.]